MHRNRQGWIAGVAGAMALGAMPAAVRAAEDPTPAPADRLDASVKSLALPEVAFGQSPARETLPTPAKPPRDIYAGDYLIVGLGAAVLPAYEGSHRHHVIPAFGLGGRIHGIGISPRSAGLAFNLIPPRGSRIGLSFGPVIRYRGTRTVAISDPTPIRVGRSKGNLELGLNASISVKHILSKYDSLSVGTDLRWDASGGTGSRVIAPGINYFTPVSKAQVIGLSASADFYNQRMANQSYGVTPAPGSVGTPGTSAPHAGLRSVGGRIFTAYDLDRNLLDGGFSILFGIGYSRLVGSAARSPLVKSNGTHDQIVIGTGLAFAFRTRR